MKFLKMVLIVSILTVTIGVGGTLYIYFNRDKLSLPFLDSINFKEEYESLNNKMIPNTNYTYKYLEISDNNHFRYSSYEDIFNILENGTGIIYFGYNSCMNCRNIVNVLDEVARHYDKDIYYLDIHKDKKSNDYRKLTKKLEKHLTYYVDKKRSIVSPTVVFVKDGKILGLHENTVEEHNEYYSLNATEEEKLKLIYKSYLKDM